MMGMGYLIDLGAFDQMIGIENPYLSSVEVFTDRGSLAHLALGALAGWTGDGWSVAISAAFGGYELGKLEAGEQTSRIAGTLIEFGLGALLAALVRYAR